jgi:ABC-type branched-subunit amino acid transport system ATPase component
MRADEGAETLTARLEMLGVSKAFPGVRALERVDFRVREGEAHALLGENGAGKVGFIATLISFNGSLNGAWTMISRRNSPVLIHRSATLDRRLAEIGKHKLRREHPWGASPSHRQTH